MKNLFILNDGPYGNERSYNALRMATAVAKEKGQSVRLFLIGEGVGCARKGQETPNGFYNVERMLKGLAKRGAEIAV